MFAKPENDDRICYLKGKGNELPNISLVCNLQTTKWKRTQHLLPSRNISVLSDFQWNHSIWTTKIKSFAVVKKNTRTVALLPSVASSHLCTIPISASTVEEPDMMPNWLGSTTSSHAGLMQSLTTKSSEIFQRDEVREIGRSSFLGSKTCLTFGRGVTDPQASTQKVTFVPRMNNSKCHLLAALGVLRTPLTNSLTVRQGLRELCACLDVSSYWTLSE